MCKLVSMKLYGGGELLVAEHKKEHILKYMMMLGSKGFLILVSYKKDKVKALVG